MAGYYLYSLNSDVFSKLTTQPTDGQAQAVAAALLLELDDFDADEFDPQKLTKNLDTLAPLVKKRLAAGDWYSDLTYHQAVAWDSMLGRFSGDLGRQLGLDFQCTSDWESIYWDCATAAEQQGATMMAEPSFGNSGFRYSGAPTSNFNPFPMYTYYEPSRVQQLLAQLEAVAPWFQSQDDDETEEEFMEGLLYPVRATAGSNRLLWVQTDT